MWSRLIGIAKDMWTTVLRTAVSTISIVITIVVVLVTERLVGLESLYWGQ